MRHIDFHNIYSKNKDIEFKWIGGTFCTTIPSLEQARQLLGTKCEKMRKLKSSVYYNSKEMFVRQKLMIGAHDRGEEFVWADGTLCDKDKRVQDFHLPAHLKVMQYEKYIIRKDEIFDVTSKHDFWEGVHFREELYVYIHIKKLYVEKGARLSVRGNVLTLVCDEVILIDSENEDNHKFDFQIKILGTDYFGYGKARSKEEEEMNGFDGKDGCVFEEDDLKSYEYINTLFGRIKVKKKSFIEPDIQDPKYKGQNGENGKNGVNGGMSMLADIRIGKLSNFSIQGFQVFAQASAGKNGGDGGKGGDGVFPGNGGKGGNGGNGGLSSNIFVTSPQKYRKFMNFISLESIGGKAGKGGESGKKSIEIQKFMQKTLDGTNGKDGRNRQAPPIYFFQSQRFKKYFNLI